MTYRHPARAVSQTIHRLLDRIACKSADGLSSDSVPNRNSAALITGQGNEVAHRDGVCDAAGFLAWHVIGSSPEDRYDITPKRPAPNPARR